MSKNTLFEYFWAKIFKNSCHIWNQHPQICLIGNFAKKQKCLNLEPKMLYFIFRYYWARILKNCCHIWNQHSRICLIAKFCEKLKMPKFGTKNVLFGHFWARSFNNYCHIWNLHPRIRQTFVFDSYNEFWYRVRFF